jgi:2-haloacid dehalogenase
MFQSRISKPVLGLPGLIVRTLLAAAIVATIFLTGSADAQTKSMSNLQKPRPKVIFLDVNETLLDLEPLKVSVAKALDGRQGMVGLWFSMLLHHSLVDTLTGIYHHFSEVGVATLQMLAESNGIELSKEDAESAIIPVIRSLPPHPDVIEGLKSLKKQGFLLVSLTNSSNAGVKEQFKNAGLMDIVDRHLTVEGIKKFKPDLGVYRWALEQVDVEAGDAMMVAAHGWDIAGAAAAGLQTVFVARPGKVPYPLAEKPDHVVKDIKELAGLLGDPSK